MAGGLLGVLLTLLVSGGLGEGPPGAAERGVDGVGDRPVVTSASEIDYPPFCFVDDQGRISGFSVELLRAALRAAGRDVTFKVGAWADVRGWLERGEVQALPLVGRTPEREPVFDFTFPYVSLHGAIVVRAGTKGLESLRDLAGHQVAVMAGDNAEEFLRRQGQGLTIKTTVSFQEALRELSAGQHDAVVIQRLVALRLIQETGLENLQIVERPVDGFRQDFSFAVQEGDRDTLALLNEGLSVVMADGTFAHLHAKWFAALELPSQRRLVVGGDSNYPPFEYLDSSGRPAGFNVELTRAIAQELGLDVEIRLRPWAEIRRQLARGEIDVLQGMFYSPERDREFDFAPAHLVNSYVAVVRQGGTPAPESLADLAGRRLVVQRGDIAHDHLLEHGLGANVEVVDDQEAALAGVAAGRHDCAVVSRLTAAYWIHVRGWTGLEVGQRPLLAPGYCYAVLQGQKALVAQFGEGLRIVSETGEYRRIYEKWMGVYDDSSADTATILRYVGWVAGPLLLLLAGFVLWLWSLRRQVARRTDELVRTEARFRSLVEGAPSAIFVQTERRFAYLNANACQLFGATSPEQLLGTPVVDRFHPDQRAMVAHRIDRLNDHRERMPSADEILLKLDGTELHVEVSAVPISYDGKNGALVFFHDISPRRQAERERESLQAQLRQSQKIESVGRLAGGVAHDFNNMLSVISGNAELALERLGPQHPASEDLREILDAARRSTQITRQLLAFARKQTINPRALSLNEVVEGTLKMLRRLIGEDIELAWMPGPELWPVKVDPAQIDQLLANLCVNARDAIGGVGRVTIRSQNAVLDQAWCAGHAGSHEGAFVKLTVTDDGCGMSQETLERIFEPFFTTKDVGRGTGLGLATVYGIVKQNGGFIEVSSGERAGSTFDVYLPRYVGTQGTASQAGDVGTATPAGHGETVLLVEDEPAILRLAQTLLERLGYQVLAANLPTEALLLAQEHEGPIQLLLTDVVMPGMNGRELANRIQATRPGLRVLYVSGYTAEVIATRGILEAGVSFIQKPFTSSELAAKVHRTLVTR
jgi:two-component system sensor histidine kinase EvgS